MTAAMETLKTRSWTPEISPQVSAGIARSERRSSASSASIAATGLATVTRHFRPAAPAALRLKPCRYLQKRSGGACAGAYRGNLPILEWRNREQDPSNNETEPGHGQVERWNAAAGKTKSHCAESGNVSSVTAMISKASPRIRSSGRKMNANGTRYFGIPSAAASQPVCQ